MLNKLDKNSKSVLKKGILLFVSCGTLYSMIVGCIVYMTYGVGYTPLVYPVLLIYFFSYFILLYCTLKDFLQYEHCHYHSILLPAFTRNIFYYVLIHISCIIYPLYVAIITTQDRTIPYISITIISCFTIAIIVQTLCSFHRGIPRAFDKIFFEVNDKIFFDILAYNKQFNLLLKPALRLLRLHLAIAGIAWLALKNSHIEYKLLYPLLFAENCFFLIIFIYALRHFYLRFFLVPKIERQFTKRIVSDFHEEFSIFPALAEKALGAPRILRPIKYEEFAK